MQEALVDELDVVVLVLKVESQAASEHCSECWFG